MHGTDDTARCSRELAAEAETLALGADLAQHVHGGMTIYLQGDLGAGKTTLVRGLLRALGFSGRVKSPTYTLTEIYGFPGFELYHFDLYRMQAPREWLDAGFREVADARTVTVIEWPDKAAGLLPPPDLIVRLRIRDEGRVAELVARTLPGKECLKACCKCD